MPINNPSTYLWMAISKAVPAESYHPASVIARQSFGITIQPRLPGGYVDSNYRGNIRIYANSPSSDTAFLLGGVYRSAGDTGFTYASATISSVYNESSFRKITLVDDDGKTVSMNVGVWFKGRATVFQGGPDSYYVDRGCTPLTTNYVALPSYHLCGKQVAVANMANNRVVSAPVNDVGPYFDKKYCDEDEYWKNGTVPRAEQPGYLNKPRCEACNVPCNTTGDKYKITGAIIDLSPAMMSSLGGSSEITCAWRFT